MADEWFEPIRFETNAELAKWLRKTPGEVYLPVMTPICIAHMRAHKGDLIERIEDNLSGPDWYVSSMPDHGPGSTVLWKHRRIFLDVDEGERS